MTNTIPNVPRELLERVLYLMDNYIGTTHHEEDELRALLSAPSSAGVDGLNTDRNAAFKACPESGCDWGSFYLGWKARGEVEQAIIDGLRGESHQLQLELRLRQSQIESSGRIAERAQRFSVLLRTDRDQQTQRICELEGLLQEASDTYRAAIRWGDLRGTMKRIDAALSAGKEKQDEHS